MDIKPAEVESIKTIGRLHDDEVKLIRTFGGFNVAIGKKKKGSKPEALAAGSHIALVNHQLIKQFKTAFEPILAKSEHEQLPLVKDESNLLPNDLYNRGLELYVLSKNNNIDFILYKHGITLAQYNTEINGDVLEVKNYHFKKHLLPNHNEVVEVLAKSMQNKINELGLTRVK